MLSNKRRESSVSICQGKGCVRRLTIAAVFLGVFFLALGSAAQVNAWVVIFQAGPGGSVLPVGPQMVADMGSTSGTANPNANYHFVDWTINAGAGNGTFSALDQPNLSITNVTGDIAVTANFADRHLYA